jgi:predicted permease
VLRLFALHLLPVFLIAGAGWLFAWRTRVDPRGITQLAFAVLAPVFVFDVIYRSTMGTGEFLRTVGFASCLLLGLGALTALAGRVLGWSRPLTAAAMLVVMVPNTGNFGLSANLFAFGEAGLPHASLFFAVSSILTFTSGVFVASLGRMPVGTALAGLLRVPAVWAVFAAFALRGAALRLPLPVERAVELLGGACVPVFLVILGMQLRVASGPAPRGAQLHA